MRMALRRSATAGALPARRVAALTARLLAVLAMTSSLACAGRGNAAPQTAADAPSTSKSTATAHSSSAAPGAARVQEAAFTEDTDGARLVLSANAPLLYTAYEPRPDLLVVDLPGIGVAAACATPTASGTLVSSVKVESLSEMGKQVTRLSVVHREGIHFDIRSLGQGLALSF